MIDKRDLLAPFRLDDRGVSEKVGRNREGRGRLCSVLWVACCIRE